MYLSPQVPRWSPQSEDDLLQALARGLLEESHYLDLKREVEPGKGANKELARDLAQFAVDGGALIIGVEEHKDGPPTLAPVELDGLPERVEQIARSIPDPPLPVTCQAITSAADPARGYLVVKIGASGLAPHMVEGVYFGRDDRTKLRLSDAEVLRLHQGRGDVEDRAKTLLDAYVRRDPVPALIRAQAHLFVVVAPVSPRREMLLDAVHGEGWHKTFHQLKSAGDAVVAGGQFAPDLPSAGRPARRADGAAMTYGLTEDRRLDPTTRGDQVVEDALELELSEDGVVRLFTSRLSDQVRGQGQLVFVDMIPVLTRRALSVAQAASEHCGYHGPWLVGVAATGIAGLGAYETRGWGSGPGLPQDHGDYQQVTTTSSAELAQAPGAVAGRVVGRLLRAFGQADAMVHLLTDGPQPER